MALVNPIYQIFEETGEKLQLRTAGGTAGVGYVLGSWTAPVRLDNGHWQESFTLIIKPSSGTPGAVRFQATKAGRLFMKALYHQGVTGAENPIWLLESTYNEAQRRAYIYGGTITPVDDAVIGRDLLRSAGQYIVTIERGPWESINWWQKSWNGTAHGSYFLTPEGLASEGNMPARIAYAALSPESGYGGRWWVGIKPAYRSLSAFRPSISVGAATVDLEANSGSYLIGDSNFIGSKGVGVSFSSNSGWQRRFRCPLILWNTEVNNQAKIDNTLQYIGEYVLLARYRTSAQSDSSARWGVRVDTGHTLRVPGTSRVTYQMQRENAPVYLSATEDGAFRYVSLGRIQVGDRWSTGHTRRVRLTSFTLGIQATLAQASTVAASDVLEFDNFVIVPADHYLQVSAAVDFGNNEQLTVLTLEDGSVQVYRTERMQYGWTGDISGAASYDSEIREQITEFTATNWAMPWQDGSRIVVVNDKLEGNDTSKATTAEVDLEVEIYPRTELYLG